MIVSWKFEPSNAQSRLQSINKTTLLLTTQGTIATCKHLGDIKHIAPHNTFTNWKIKESALVIKHSIILIVTIQQTSRFEQSY
jgi:hypothetical protein